MRYQSRTMSPRLLASSFPLLVLFACGVTPAGAAADPATSASPGAKKDAAGTGDAAKQKEQEAKQKEEDAKRKARELRSKQRELASAGTEQRVAEIERSMRQLGVDAALAKTALELEAAQKNLKVFLEEVKPRELEEKKIGVDQSTYRAEHQKDELGELTAMYDADEFARTTKELVLKRGRRELEMAERYLAVARKDLAYFEGVTMPQRERELRQKVADAEFERKKAEFDAQKAEVEFLLALEKAKNKVAGLEEDIADLQQALAKETP